MSVNAGGRRAAGADAHLILAGAGLASALIAQRLSQRAAAPRILILESRRTAFADRTWSFHEADVAPEDRVWIDPLVAHRWRAQEVRFQSYTRRLETGYASLTPDSVRRALASLPNVEIVTDVRVRDVQPDRAVLANGTHIDARCAIDARGFTPHAAIALGYQKFVGLEVETGAPHGLAEPVIMDARVEQRAGYRFVYLLPFSATRLLIEDTIYADDAALDVRALEACVHAYADANGWRVQHVLRREQGVLPIALAFDAARFWADRPQDVPQVGMRAALFHPTTGYSLPEAVRAANLIASLWPIGSAELAARIRAHALARAREQRFYRLLARMLFRAAAPERRHRVMERFYRLPLPLIQRFYAGETTAADRARILCGKPPVSLLRALACIPESTLLKAGVA